MRKCPKCNRRLTGADVTHGTCPHCHKQLVSEAPSSRADPTVAVDGTLRPNVEASLEGKGQTVLSSERPKSQQPDLPDQNGGDATIDLSRTSPATDTTSDVATPADTMAGPAVVEPTSPPPSSRSGSATTKSDDAPQASDVNDDSAWQDRASGFSILQTMKLEDRQDSQIYGTYGTVIRPRNVKMPNEPAVLEADYEILEQLGEGGMGIVYRAKQCSMNREVAIKRIKGSHPNEETKAKFLTEAAVTGELAHPNIVPIHDLGTNESGDLFYAMKVVAGDCWLDVLPQKSREENIDILMRVADAVAFAHSHDILHRDLKPENVMLGNFGEVLVMDWGLAGKLEPGVRLPSGGTPGYLAPEMAIDLLTAMKVDTGDLPEQPIGKQSDIYLLGAILFEIITGQPPHFSSGRQTAMNCLQRAAQNEFYPTDIDKDELLSIAFHAMETKGEDRFPTVATFQQAVREYQDHAQSIQLATRAEENLEEGKGNGDYETLAKAQYGFQDAIELWEHNQRATKGLGEAKLAFAETAYRNQDFDLGMSLLDPEQPDQRKWHDRLRKARNARNARRSRLRLATVVTIVLLLAVCGLATMFGLQQQNFALKEAGLRTAAEKARDEKEIARQREVVARKDAEEAQEKEATARKEAEDARNKEETARKLAEDAAIREREAKEAEADARLRAERNEADAKYGKFVSDIALADAKLVANDTQRALAILEPMRAPDEAGDFIHDWEWHYLYHQCHTEVEHFEADGKNPVVAVTPSGDRWATVAVDIPGRRIVARLWRGGEQRHQLEQVFPLENLSVLPTAAAISRDGRLVLIGLSTRRTSKANLLVWDTTANKATDRKMIHNGDLRSLAFSDQRNWLVTAGLKTYSGVRLAVRLWKVKGSVLEEFPLHGLLSNGRSKPDGHNQASVNRVRLDPSGLRIAELNSQNQLLIRQLDSEGNSTVSPSLLEIPDAVAAVFLPDDPDRLLVVASNRLFLVQLSDKVKVTAEKDATPHTLPIRDMDLSQDGQTFVTASEDRTLVHWDLKTLSPLKRLRGHQGPVLSCRFASRRGKDVVISADASGTIKNFTPADYLDELTVEAGRQMAVANLSADGAFFAARQTLSSIAIRNRANTTLSTISMGHVNPKGLRAFYSQATNRLVTAAADGSVWMWSATGEPLQRLAPAVKQGGVSTTEHVAMSPNGKYFVRYVRSATKRYDIWQLDSGERSSVVPEGNPTTAQVLVDSVGDLILMVGSDSVSNFLLRKADGQKSGPTEEFKNSRRRSKYVVLGVRDSDAAVVGVDESKIMIWSDEQTLRRVAHSLTDRIVKGELKGDMLLLELKSPRAIWLADTSQNEDTWQRTPPSTLLDAGLQDVCLGENGKLVYVLGDDNSVRSWDLADNSVEISGALMPREDNRRLSLAGASSGQCITYAPSGEVSLWDLTESQELARCHSGLEITDVHFLGPHPESNRRHLLTFSDDRVLRLWDVESVLRGESKPPTLAWQRFHRRLHELQAVAVGPQSWHVLVAQAASPDSVELLDVDLVNKTEESLTKLDVPAFALRSLCWDKDMIVAATADGEVHSLVRSTGRELAPLNLGDNVVTARLSHDGNRLAVATMGGYVVVYALGPDGKWQAEGIKVPNSGTLATEVTAIAFSHSGERLLVGDGDGHIDLWHVDTDKRTSRNLMSLAGHERPIRSLWFSADGQTLLSSDQRRLIVRFTSGWN